MWGHICFTGEKMIYSFIVKHDIYSLIAVNKFFILGIEYYYSIRSGNSSKIDRWISRTVGAV